MLALIFSFSINLLAPESVSAVTPAMSNPATQESFEASFPAVLEALDPTTDGNRRFQAIAELASAKDARFIPVFEALLNDRDFLVERAAVRALGAISEPTATRVLSQVAQYWPGIVSDLAYEALGDQQSDAAAAALFRIQQDGKLTFMRRKLATETLRERYAHLRESYPPGALQTNAGLTPFVLASGELGAINLMAIGYAGLNPELGAPLGFLSGGAVGLGAGYLIGKEKQFSAIQGFRLLSYENWGLLGGYWMGQATVRNRPFHTGTQEGRFIAAASAMGATAGYITALYDDAPLTLTKQVYVDVSGVAAGSMAFGILTWVPRGTRSLGGVGIINAVALSGLVASRFALPDLDINQRDSPLLFSAPLIGAWIAPWTAYAINPNGRHIEGWFYLGAGSGWFTGLALAHYWEDPANTVMTANFFSIYGTALGLGLPLVSEPESKRSPSLRATSLLAGGAAGFSLGVLLADELTMKPSSQLLVLSSTLFGAFQGAGLSAYNEQSKLRNQGWGLIGGVAGGAAALVTTQFYDITPSISHAVLAGEGLGAWFSVIGGDRLHLEGRDLLLSALIGTDVGLVGTAILVGPLGVNPSRIAWASVFGLGGAGICATAAALATPNRDHIETATLAGTAVGAVVGGYFAPRFSVPKGADLKTGLRMLSVQPWIARMDGSSAPGLNVVFEVN